MDTHERPVLHPTVTHTVSPTGRDEGYEIEFERINRFGERASSFMVSELSLDDLRALYYELGEYLDRERHQE